MTSFLLTPGQLDVLWHDLDLGRLPYPLDVPRARERVAVRERPGLADLLRLLADHEVAVDAVAGLGGPVRALAAADHRHGVLAVLADDVVSLTEIRPTALARAAVSVLPENVSGPGAPRTLRMETLHRAVALHEGRGDNPWGDEELDERTALSRAGLSPEDAKAVADLAANRVAGGQFGVTSSDHGRASVLVTWFDTHQGRYLMVRDNHWLSIAPTDNDRIAARIDATLSTVAAEHRKAPIR